MKVGNKMKTLIIDIRPIVSKIHQQWDGNGTFNKHLNKKATKELIITTIENITTHSLHNAKYTFNMKDRELKITVEWDESINVNQWNNTINETLKNCVHSLIQKDIISYVA